METTRTVTPSSFASVRLASRASGSSLPVAIRMQSGAVAPFELSQSV